MGGHCTSERLHSSPMPLWPQCFLPAGGCVSCLAYPCSYSGQQLLSLTLFGRVFRLYLLKPRGQCTSHNFSSPPDPLHWDVLQPISFLQVPLYQRRTLNICKLRSTVISMPRSAGTPVFSFESYFLEQSSASECEINASFALMFMLSIPLRETGW